MARIDLPYRLGEQKRAEYQRQVRGVRRWRR
jgi:hypothetical protein